MREIVLTSQELMRPRNCPLCNNDDFNVLIKFSNFQYYSDYPNNQTTLQHVQCKQCSCLYMNPTFTDAGFEHLLRESGQSYGATPNRNVERLQWLNENAILTGVHSVLDIGCFHGDFLSKFPDTIKKIGVDIDLNIIAEARRRRPEMHFYKSSFKAFKLEQSVDLVTLLHVWEHLLDPVEFIQNLYRQLPFGSKLFIEIPILDLAMTNDVCGFFNAHHTVHFSERTAVQAMLKTDWRIEVVQQMTSYNALRIICKKNERQSNFQKLDYANSERLLLYQYWSEWYQSLEKIETEILKFKKIISDKTLVIWGAGLHSEFLYQNTSLEKLIEAARKTVIVDSDPMKLGKKWRNIEIIESKNLKSWEDCILIPSSYFHHDSIIRIAREDFNVPSENVIALYDNIKVC